MRTAETIDKEIEALQAEKETLLEKQKGFWKPEVGENYFVIDMGVIHQFVNNAHAVAIFNIQTGNYFRTREQAELWLKIHNRVHELIGDWEADWNNLCQWKYFVDWDWRMDSPSKGSSKRYQNQGTTYMFENTCNQLISEFGQDLKIWATRWRQG